MKTKTSPPSRSPGSIRDFRRALRFLEREVELSLASQTECCGITSAQCHILLEMDSRGAASVGELAEAIELDPSTMSRAVDGLVKAGLATRAENPANRRKSVLCLTALGKGKVDYIDGSCDEYYESVLSEADDDRRAAIAENVAFLAKAIRAKRLAVEPCCPIRAKGKA
jgi:DNA-binding MarR family transcriptional regulator